MYSLGLRREMWEKTWFLEPAYQLVEEREVGGDMIPGISLPLVTHVEVLVISISGVVGLLGRYTTLLRRVTFLRRVVLESFVFGRRDVLLSTTTTTTTTLFVRSPRLILRISLRQF